jgi:RecG-like helicase
MSSFEILGTVTEATPATSNQGKAYLKFIVTDGDNMFNLSLFGNTMNFANLITVGNKVAIKGMLSSREYQGKHYPNFQVQWVESSDIKATPAMLSAASAIDSIPF